MMNQFYSDERINSTIIKKLLKLTCITAVTDVVKGTLAGNVTF